MFRNQHCQAKKEIIVKISLVPLGLGGSTVRKGAWLEDRNNSKRDFSDFARLPRVWFAQIQRTSGFIHWVFAIYPLILQMKNT
jgi:hypothetical protein